MRLIDADALQFEPKNGVLNGVLFMGRATGKTLSLVQSCLEAMINNAPTIDAVPVVRCGRCKWGKAYKAWEGQAGFKCELLCVDIGVNDFCSYGERR